MKETRRLFYLDNLRVAVIILVIAHHVGQAYGPTGGWWPVQEEARAPLLGPFFTVNRSFFMSLFFMISGYFSVRSYRSKGARTFLRERALRLGLPVLAFALVMIPLQTFVFAPGSPPFPLEAGHLWFLEHLLLFSLGYALWRQWRAARGAAAERLARPPGTAATLTFALALAAVTGVVRIWFPIDRWVYLLGFFRVAFADVPRDLAFFVVGLLAGERDWFSRYPARAGYLWLGAGLALAALYYACDLALCKTLPAGGLGLDILRLVWEMLLCCGMCIGLTVLFRERLGFTNGTLGAMARAQYAAYIFHVLFVLLFQFLVLGLPLPPLAKFALVTLAAVPATFLFSAWVRKPLRL